MAGQLFTGFTQHNKERQEAHQPAISMSSCLHSGHFIQATFENWESEFLQMALFVVLTLSLKEKGSSESKKCDGPEEVDRGPSTKQKDAPWPVKKGVIILKVYSLAYIIHTFFCSSFSWKPAQ